MPLYPPDQTKERNSQLLRDLISGHGSTGQTSPCDLNWKLHRNVESQPWYFNCHSRLKGMGTSTLARQRGDTYFTQSFSCRDLSFWFQITWAGKMFYRGDTGSHKYFISISVSYQSWDLSICHAISNFLFFLVKKPQEFWKPSQVQLVGGVREKVLLHLYKQGQVGRLFNFLCIWELAWELDVRMKTKNPLDWQCYCREFKGVVNRH